MSSQRLARQRTLSSSEIDQLHHIPSSLLTRVRLIRTNFLPPAAAGMTLGRFVFLRGDRIGDEVSLLLAHELVHARQFVEQGPLRFIYRYVYDYFKNLLRLRNHRQAYLEIPYEIEAREEAARWMAAQEAS